MCSRIFIRRNFRPDKIFRIGPLKVYKHKFLFDDIVLYVIVLLHIYIDNYTITCICSVDVIIVDYRIN